jgi:hypothetical protein
MCRAVILEYRHFWNTVILAILSFGISNQRLQSAACDIFVTGEQNSGITPFRRSKQPLYPQAPLARIRVWNQIAFA